MFKNAQMIIDTMYISIKLFAQSIQKLECKLFVGGCFNFLCKNAVLFRCTSMMCYYLLPSLKQSVIKAKPTEFRNMLKMLNIHAQF